MVMWLLKYLWPLLKRAFHERCRSSSGRLRFITFGQDFGIVAVTRVTSNKHKNLCHNYDFLEKTMVNRDNGFRVLHSYIRFFEKSLKFFRHLIILCDFVTRVTMEWLIYEANIFYLREKVIQNDNKLLTLVCSSLL